MNMDFTSIYDLNLSQDHYNKMLNIYGDGLSRRCKIYLSIDRDNSFELVKNNELKGISIEAGQELESEDGAVIKVGKDYKKIEIYGTGGWRTGGHGLPLQYRDPEYEIHEVPMLTKHQKNHKYRFIDDRDGFIKTLSEEELDVFNRGMNGEDIEGFSFMNFLNIQNP